MGDRTGDSFRGWVYALGLCGGGQGALGLLVCLSFAFRRVPWRDGVVDCWDLGMGSEGLQGVCFGLGISFLGLHIIYMTNVTS